MVSSRITRRAFMIDTVGMGNPSTIAVYVVKGGRRTAVVDCGYASTYGNVMQGLRELGVEPSRVDYLIPTHLHLDHAGATGHLLRHMPRARVIAHERAVPHLVDPTKLVESATSLFGEKLVQMYGKPLPVDKNKITAVGAESHIDLGGATLTTLYAPGHAPHQISVLFEEEHLLFSADAVGMVFPSFPTLLPTTPPPSLDPMKLVQSLEKLRQTDPKMLLVPHYGVRKDVGLVLDRTKEKTEEWVREVTRLHGMHLTPEQIVVELRKKITEETGIPPEFPGYVNVMIRASVLGIVSYLTRGNSSTLASKT
ncbi:MAG TPA: MBL fold metallo-hydrolase [Nitrososphaerales archaeon]|nr:MBL fold metallo-hydrolase [Nitrososphaerales archaeon]